MEPKVLPRVTLIACDTVSPGRALASLRKSLTQIKPAKTILFTSVGLAVKDDIEVVKIPSLKSKADYSTWIIRELHKHIDTDFILISQWDSYVLDGELWDDEFLSVDYIGASWLETDGFSVGNGGFSGRSRRLMEAVANDTMIVSTHPEDNMICKVYRPYLEAKYGFKWASQEMADRFSFELREPAQPTFGFHSFFHQPFKKTIIIRRKASLGDVVMCEPVLRYFHEKGYRVVLKTLPQFYNLFYSHEFKVHHPDEVDPKILDGATEIDLDMSYESTPEQLHLLSYYQMAGIGDGEIKNPKLFTGYDYRNPDFKLFRKYCVLHIDERPQEGRNIYGVDWDEIVDSLSAKGYTVVQIGQGKHIVPKGAVEMRNMNEPMLMRLIGGADLMIAIDSGPSNIALAMKTPLIVFFGNVHPDYIIPNRENVTVIQNHNPEKPICRLPHCWSSTISTEGVECVETMGQIKRVVKMFQGAECLEDAVIPPCVRFTTQQVIDAINQRI
jgi:ADP-heptose:LPS heptosyltransferase